MSSLAIVHNLTESNILFSKKWLSGELPCPSLAVVKAQNGLKGFGEITLVKRPDLHDFQKEPAYTSDVYTQRVPTVQFKANESVLSSFYDEIVELIGDDMEGLKHNLSSLKYRLIDDYSEGFSRVNDDLSYNPAAKLAFMRKNNIEIPLPMQEKRAPYAFLKDEVLLDKIKPLMPVIWNSENADKLAVMVVEHISEKANNSKAPSLLKRELERVFYSKKEGESQRAFRPVAFDRIYNFLSGPRQLSTVDSYQLNSRIDEHMEKDPSLVKKFSDWLSNSIEGAYHSPYFFDVNRKVNVQFNKDNLVNYMKRRNIAADSTNLSGAGNLRALVSTPLRNQHEVSSHADMLVSNEEFSKVKERMNDLYASIPEKIACHYRFDAESWGYMDDCLDMVRDYVKSGRREIFDEGYRLDEIPESFFKELDDFVDMLSKEKTEYFEINIERSMSFDEFELAIVPESVSPEVVEVLSNAGLQMHTYPDDDLAARNLVLQEMGQALKIKVENNRQQEKETLLPSF